MMNFTKRLVVLFIFFMVSTHALSTTSSIKPKSTNMENQNQIVDPEQEINKAEELFFRGDYKLALPKLLQLVRFPKKPQEANISKNILARAYILLGTFHLRKGSKISAESYYNEYIKLDSEVKVKKEKYGEDVFQAIEILKKQYIKQKSQAKEKYISNSKKQKDKEEFSKKVQVVVIKEDAVLKLDPNDESMSIRKLPLGALLNVRQILNEWIKIELMPNKYGIAVVGYVKSSFVRLESNEIKQSKVK